MRRYFYITIGNFLLVLLQESFIAEFLGPALTLNLILAMGFGYLIADDDETALFSVFIGGFFMDMAATRTIGLSSVIMVGLLIIARLIKRYLTKGIIVQFVFIILSGIFVKLALNYPALLFSWKVVFSAILTGLIALGSYAYLTRSSRKFLSAEYRIKA